MSYLGARFDEHQVMGLGLVFPLLRRDLPLIVKVGLVTNENDNHVVATLASDVIDPLPGVLKGFCVYKTFSLVDVWGSSGVSKNS